MRKFNPPFAPWMDGAMDSMVKITKVLNTNVRGRIFTDEALSTCFTEVDSITNR